MGGALARTAMHNQARALAPVLLALCLHIIGASAISFEELWAVAGPVADERLKRDEVPMPPSYPTVTNKASGNWDANGAKDWVAGYLTGCAWKMLALTGDPAWRDMAGRGQVGLEADGFQYWDSGNVGHLALEAFHEAIICDPGATPDQTAWWQQTLVQAAITYAGRCAEQRQWRWLFANNWGPGWAAGRRGRRAASLHGNPLPLGHQTLLPLDCS